jgi:hypothetical protein
LKLIGLLLRLYSYLYHLVLSLFLLGLAIITMASGQNNLVLNMLPWKGEELTRWVLALSLIGLITTLLAITGVFRFLFPLWCLAVVVLMIRGFFLSPFVFSGPEQFRSVIWLVVGAVVAFLASLMLYRSKSALRLKQI